MGEAMFARDMRGLVRRLALACLCALTGSCYYAPPEIMAVEPDPPPAAFAGITQMPTDRATQRLRILFIHGMGVATPCSADTLLYHLSNAMHLTPFMPASRQPGPACPHFVLQAPLPVPAPSAHSVAQLYRVDLRGGGGRMVTFMYLLWSPLTDVPKNDVDGAGHPHRALSSNLVKDFMKSHVADVVLYGGTYRDVLRPAIENALCQFIEGTPDKTDPRFCDNGKPDIPTSIITHSLGGYMLMDALSDLTPPPETRADTTGQSSDKVERRVSYEAGYHLNQIFMLANQVAMLDLSTRTSEENIPEAASNVARRFHEAWDTMRAGRDPNHVDKFERQVLAISDPNDILSWKLAKGGWEVADATKPVRVANVYLGTTAEVPGLYYWPFLGLTADPVAAHTNYLEDDDVMDIIACGMSGSTINRCAQ